MQKTAGAIAFVGVGILVLAFAPDPARHAIRATTASATGPVRSLARTAGGFAGRQGDRVQDQSANVQLYRRIAELQTRIRELERHQAENDFLKRLLAVRSRHQYVLVACRVVARDDVTGWYDMMELDKGTADGLNRGTAVIDVNGALVGQVRQVQRRSALVQLITAPGSKIPCLVKRSNAACLLYGGQAGAGSPDQVAMLSPKGPNYLYQISKLTDVKPRDDVYTSGFGKAIPPDIFVGIVATVADQEEPGVVKAEVELGANFQQLPYVFAVLTDE